MELTSIKEQVIAEGTTPAAPIGGDRLPVSNEVITTPAQDDGAIDLLEILKKPTGEGDITDPIYMQHPFNYDGKKSTARILRGLTGMLGNINFAVADIILGVIEKWQERKGDISDPATRA